MGETGSTSQFLRELTASGVSAHSPRSTRRYLEFLFHNTPLRDRRVLDIGGGRGLLSFWAAFQGAAHVACVDPLGDGSQADAFRVFETFRAAHDFANVEYFQEAVGGHAAEQQYDVILLHDAINHLDEDAYARLPADETAFQEYVAHLARIRDMAGEDARLLVTDCSRRNFFADLGFVAPAAPTIEWRIHQPPQVVSSLLRAAGFDPSPPRWTPVRRLGVLGHLGRARVGAYFLHSHFLLEAGARPHWR